MCHASCLMFGEDNLNPLFIEGKKVLEVGSLDMNGSLRKFVEFHNPETYIGIDLEQGQGVDKIVDVSDLIQEFGYSAFDLVISTEVLEHVKDWKKAIHNIKNVTKTGGMVLITTRGPGFPRHDHPADYWRFTLGDIYYTFRDFIILVAQEDWETPGVFIIAIKPSSYKEVDLSDFELMEAPKE